MARTSPRTKRASAAPAARPEEDKKIIRRQLAWTLGILLLAGAGAWLWTWGQDSGWGDPEKAVARKMQLGEAAFVAGRLDEAVAQYKSVAKRYPQNPQAVQALTQLATALQQQGRLAEALAALEQLEGQVAGKPDKADLRAYTLLQIAKVKKDQTDFAGSLAAYQRVRDEAPHTDWSGEAQSGIGSVLQAQQKYPEARAAFAVLVKELPGGFLAAEAQTDIGQCYESEGDVRKAIQAYQVVLDKYPSAVWDTAKARLEALKRDVEKTAPKHPAAKKG